MHNTRIILVLMICITTIINNQADLHPRNHKAPLSQRQNIGNICQQDEPRNQNRKDSPKGKAKAQQPFISYSLYVAKVWHFMLTTLTSTVTLNPTMTVNNNPHHTRARVTKKGTNTAANDLMKQVEQEKRNREEKKKSIRQRRRRKRNLKRQKQKGKDGPRRCKHCHWPTTMGKTWHTTA